VDAGRLLYLDEVMRWVLAAELQLERLQVAIRAHNAFPPREADELSADEEVVQARLRADTHFFFNALAQVVKALEENAYGPPLSPWPEPLRTDTKHLRDLLEHWEQARRKGHHLRDVFAWAARRSGAEFRRRHPGVWPFSTTTDRDDNLIRLAQIFGVQEIRDLLAATRLAAEVALREG
jgi:hypothetical protein